MKISVSQDSLCEGEKDVLDEQQRVRLEEILNRERQYRLAIMEGAAAIYEINLSKDMLMRDSGYYNDEEYHIAERVGLQTPCVYSEYVSRMAEIMLGKDREAFLQASLPERLLERFHNKELYTDDVYLTRDIKGKKQYLRKSYILTRNQSSGDIWALIIAKNVTEHAKMQLVQREIIEALSMEYTSIYLIDWKKDTIRLFKTQNTYPSIMQKLDDTSDSRTVLARYIDTVVYPDDREYVRRESDIDNMRKVLCTQKVLDINYRRIIERKMDHAQMHCVRVDDAMGDSNIVVAFRSIEEIVRREQEHNREKEQLALKARTDGLTGMLNKEAFRREVEEYLKHNEVSNTAFLFVDLDHFKEINDTLGHRMGDKVISDVADKMRKVFPECDFFGRFGGDEFCMFIKDVTQEALEKMLAGAQPDMKGRYCLGEVCVNVTVSIGGAYCVKRQAEYSAFLDMADEALYEAKEQGRNRYIVNVYK